MPTNRIEGRIAVFADWAWQALLVTGVCSVGVGITLAVWPNKSVTVEGTLCGLVLLATAAMQLIAAFGANIATALKVLQFIGGVTALLLALWCINSGQWVLLLALWIGMGWMVRGVVLAITAAWSDEFVGSGWQEIIGLVTAGVGMVVAVGPFETVTSLSIAVGLITLALGVTEIWTAARFERSGVGASV
ncbi:DUF308 domain-containing protein [Nocardia sp. NBC_01503]|uniref:DUF308 domain-containing protein n=1 Tax=Nocardia sp. NBC_01503 TaxID=2975997 RepID=UPI002E7C0394|nr:DUF308 domain-containing protein [Nocardia sp. NBC_01503]WTL31182.1 DUF308 domain-containing protein [Nocardia sp. NBC_01503]